MSEELVVDLQRPAGHVLDRELGLRARAAPRAHPPAFACIGAESAQRRRERNRIAHGNEQTVVALAHHLTAARDVRRDDGATRRGGLEERLRYAFAVGRQADDVRGAE